MSLLKMEKRLIFLWATMCFSFLSIGLGHLHPRPRSRRELHIFNFTCNNKCGLQNRILTVLQFISSLLQKGIHINAPQKSQRFFNSSVWGRNSQVLFHNPHQSPHTVEILLVPQFLIFYFNTWKIKQSGLFWTVFTVPSPQVYQISELL